MNCLGRSCVLVMLGTVCTAAAEPKEKTASEQKVSAVVSAEAVAKTAKPSLAVIYAQGRDGKERGIGSGFVVSDDGLIVTNLHVIGRGRAFRVQLSDGTNLPVEAVHASSRLLDLAVVKVKSEKKLKSLALAEKKLPDGVPVVVMGNPQGLKYSVVSGVLSGRREIEGRQMLQLAIPIEPGNSGGPVLDLEGNVHGIVTMKSAVTNNLGFAVTVEDLKTLLEKPNPISISQWKTIGRLSPTEWKPLYGANWQQRGGQIVVSEPGQGFGGRSLCLFKQPPQEKAYELGVFVKLEDESGAAGLIFNCDGGDKHYGFYPSNGSLRLTRFDGPTVFTWRVLQEIPSEHYRPGKWNHLKVRVEEERILCYVNDQLVIESKDRGLTAGQVGLAKFRDTDANFHRFQLQDKIPATQPTLEQRDNVLRLLPKLAETGEMEQSLIDSLVQGQEHSTGIILEEAERLQRRVDQLKQLARNVHVSRVIADLQKLLPKEGDDLDLLRAALLIARLDEEELDVDAYVAEVDSMANQLKADFPESASEADRLEALKNYLFKKNGFHGNRFDYYHPANSYMNRVIDDRTGLPITLSVLYMELAKRLDLKVEGVGLPGHFVVRFSPQKGDSQLIDVFDEGRIVSPEEAETTIRAYNQGRYEQEFLRPRTSLEILRRIVGNLQGIAQEKKDTEGLLKYFELLVAIDPEDVQSRGLRAVTRFQTGRHQAAIADLDWLLENKPEGLDLDKIREMRDDFERAKR